MCVWVCVCVCVVFMFVCDRVSFTSGSTGTSISDPPTACPPRLCVRVCVCSCMCMCVRECVNVCVRACQRDVKRGEREHESHCMHERVWSGGGSIVYKCGEREREREREKDREREKTERKDRADECVYVCLCLVFGVRERERERERTCGFFLGSFSSNLAPVTLSVASCKLVQTHTQIHKHTRTHTHAQKYTHSHAHTNTHTHTHHHTSNEAADNKVAYTIQTCRHAHPQEEAYNKQTWQVTVRRKGRDVRAVATARNCCERTPRMELAPKLENALAEGSTNASVMYTAVYRCAWIRMDRSDK